MMLYQMMTIATALTADPELGGTAGPDLSRYLIVCGTLLLMIAAVAWGVRRLFAGSIQQRAARRSLTVIDMLPLGGKRRLAVVRIYDRVFALGMGDKEVTPIAELDAAIGEQAATPPPDKADSQTFQRALAHVQAALARKREPVGIEEPQELPAATPIAAPTKTVRPARARATRTETANKTTASAAAPKKKVRRKVARKATQPTTQRLDGVIG